ncbi:THAP-type domain-containing protein, partial [Aphis craccivora]
FPKNLSKRTAWLNALNLKSIPNWKKVCSAHFSANNFIFSYDRNILRTTAVPTRNSKLIEEHSYAKKVQISSPCLINCDEFDSSPPSTSRTLSYENVNVETSQPSLFNLCTDV